MSNTRRSVVRCGASATVRTSRWTLFCLMATAGGTSVHQAAADSILQNNPGSFDVAQATGVFNGAVPIIPPAPTPPSSPYAKIDELKIRGWLLPVPGAANTLDQGLFGIRDTLANYGISYFGIEAATFSDNVIRHALPAGNQFSKHSRDLQAYSGQLPTYTSVSNAYLLYDLRRYGIPDGQIVVGSNLTTTNWNPSGPDGILLSEASYYQTLFNKKVELKAGYLQNSVEFVGAQVGGSLANGVFGVTASLLNENGEDSSNTSTPGLDVKVYLPDHFYDKVGVTRAISPDGPLAERAQNPTGASFKVSNAGVFWINEVGYRVSAAPGQASTWVRADANYTSSRYTEILSPQVRHSPNYGLYFLADRQLIQTAPHGGPGSASQGLYAGFSIEYAPPYFDRFSQYYEARIYGFGLVPGRPHDLASIVATRNIFSQEAIDVAHRQGLLAHDNVNAITGSYGFSIFHGINLNVGMQYTDHPTAVSYTRSTGSALNVLVNTIIFL